MLFNYYYAIHNTIKIDNYLYNNGTFTKSLLISLNIYISYKKRIYSNNNHNNYMRQNME